MFKDLIDGAQWAPFILSAGVKPHLSLARIIEAVIIAAIAGGVSVWATAQVLKTDIAYIKANQAEDRIWYRDMRSSFDALERYAYTHNHKTGVNYVIKTKE